MLEGRYRWRYTEARKTIATTVEYAMQDNNNQSEREREGRKNICQKEIKSARQYLTGNSKRLENNKFPEHIETTLRIDITSSNTTRKLLIYALVAVWEENI